MSDDPPNGSRPDTQDPAQAARAARAAERRRKGERFFAHADGLTLGFQMVFCIGIGTALGWYADQWLGNETPWGIIIGFFLGAAAAFKALFKMTGPRP